MNKTTVRQMIKQWNKIRGLLSALFISSPVAFLQYCETCTTPDSYCTQKVLKRHLQYSPCYYSTTVTYTGHLVGFGSNLYGKTGKWKPSILESTYTSHKKKKKDISRLKKVQQKKMNSKIPNLQQNKINKTILSSCKCNKLKTWPKMIK